MKKVFEMFDVFKVFDEKGLSKFAFETQVSIMLPNQ